MDKIKIYTPLELKLDNLVYDHHGDVHPIRDNDFYRFKQPKMDGDYGLYAIPLSGTILTETFCFEKKHHTGYWQFYSLPNGWYLAEWIADTAPAGFEKKGSFYYGDDWLEVKSVHKLQNLYYALMDQELMLRQYLPKA